MQRSSSHRTTIAIPTFNRPEFLRQTLSSLLKYSDSCEIVVINDGGNVPLDLPDQVKLINLEKNSGEAHAVNVAWSLCKSDYFVVISDDDPQPDNWLSVLTKAANLHPSYVAYFPSTYVVKENEVKLIQFAYHYDKETFHKLLRSPCLSGVLINAKLLRALHVKKLRLDGLVYPNDLIQWLQLSLSGDFLAVSEAKSYWWIHQKQTSNTLSDIMKAELYFNNVSKWILDNVDIKMRCESLIACHLRAIQLLKIDKSSLRFFLTSRNRLKSLLKNQGFSDLIILSSTIRVSFSLVLLKIKND